jgi:hypothetical protein
LKLKKLLFSTSLSLLLSACGGGGGSGKSESLPELFRVINLAPSSGALKVAIDDIVTFSDLSFGETTNYLDIQESLTEKDQRKFSVFDSKSALAELSESVEIKTGTVNTYFLTKENKKLATVLSAETSKKPASGMFRLRFINLSPTAGSSDIYLTLPSANLKSSTAAVTASAFKAASDYFETLAGEYRVRITATTKTTVVADSQALTFEAGKNYTIAIADRSSGGKPIQLIRFDDAVR